MGGARLPRGLRGSVASTTEVERVAGNSDYRREPAPLTAAEHAVRQKGRQSLILVAPLVIVLTARVLPVLTHIVLRNR